MAHAAMNAAMAAIKYDARRYDAMGWILLEAGVALLLAVFIVWFTARGKRERPPVERPPASDAKDASDRDR